MARVDPFHVEITRIALAVAQDHGFALGGGNALLAHGVVDRPTQDVDLFTNLPTGIPAAASLVLAALNRSRQRPTPHAAQRQPGSRDGPGPAPPRPAASAGDDPPRGPRRGQVRDADAGRTPDYPAHYVEYDQGEGIPLDQLQAALTEFLETGHRPTGVTWHTPR